MLNDVKGTLDCDKYEYWCSAQRNDTELHTGHSSHGGKCASKRSRHAPLYDGWNDLNEMPGGYCE